MKTKLAILLGICLLAITNSMKAQTAEETAEWLNTKLPSFELSSKYFGKVTSSTTEILHQRTEFIRTDVMKYNNITSITTYFQEETTDDSKSVRIVFFGKFNDPNSIYIILKPSITEKELNSLIKAFTHLAVLNGAKLVKDDLF